MKEISKISKIKKWKTNRVARSRWGPLAKSCGGQSVLRVARRSALLVGAAASVKAVVLSEWRSLCCSVRPRCHSRCDWLSAALADRVSLSATGNWIRYYFQGLLVGIFSFLILHCFDAQHLPLLMGTENPLHRLLGTYRWCAFTAELAEITLWTDTCWSCRLRNVSRFECGFSFLPRDRVYCFYLRVYFPVWSRSPRAEQLSLVLVLSLFVFQDLSEF